MESLEDDEEGMKHYEFLVDVCETIEVAEESFCGGARLFADGGMRIEKVKMGYEQNESYLSLSAKPGDVASMDAFFELQTILRPEEGKVGKVVRRLQEDYQKRVSEAAEATNETDTQVESDWTEPVSQGITS